MHGTVEKQQDTKQECDANANCKSSDRHKKLERQIKALQWQISIETNQKDWQVFEETLKILEHKRLKKLKSVT